MKTRYIKWPLEGIDFCEERQKRLIYSILLYTYPYTPPLTKVYQSTIRRSVYNHRGKLLILFTIQRTPLLAVQEVVSPLSPVHDEVVGDEGWDNVEGGSLKAAPGVEDCGVTSARHWILTVCG